MVLGDNLEDHSSSVFIVYCELDGIPMAFRTQLITSIFVQLHFFGYIKQARRDATKNILECVQKGEANMSQLKRHEEAGNTASE